MKNLRLNFPTNSVLEFEAIFANILKHLKDNCGVSIEDEKISEVPFSKLENFYSSINEKHLKRQFENQFLKEDLLPLLEQHSTTVSRLAAQLSKKVSIIFDNSCHYKIHHKYYHELFSSLIHIFRNAVDHGIEDPKEREKKGKKRTAQIRVSLSSFKKLKEEWVKLIIEDDGRGINIADLKENLKKSDQYNDNILEYDDDEILQMIFQAGLSTKDKVSKISGRGVGLSAVKFEVETLGGRVWVESVLGQGTTFYIEFPNMATNFKQLKNIS